MQIEVVSREFLDTMFDSLDTPDYEPRGLFLCEDTVDGKVVWVAVDNRDGKALTEEFNLKFQARAWLKGRPCINSLGQILNIGEGDG